ncbi:MAG: ABC transporter permease [Chloroflexi bacterium]|nr:ABC transporter permease [Chloroflexota bacterium]
MGSRLRALMRKEFIQMVRDRRTLAIILVMPVMQLVLFGYAINQTVDHIATVVADASKDVRSREFIQSLANTGYFTVIGDVGDAGAARRAIDEGAARVAFVIPSEFGANTLAGRLAQVQVLIDGSDPSVAQTALLTAETLARARGIELAAAGRTASSAIDLRPTVLYNPSMQSVNFMIPGLIGLVLQTQAVLLTTFAIVRERERGTFEQLIVTPIRPMELMIGKILPYVGVAFLQVGVALAVGTFWFGVPFHGSLALLLALSLLFLLGALGIGLLISTVTSNQTQGMQLAMFTILPGVLLSGFMFPREAMPGVLQAISSLIPLTYFLQVLRGTILKGVGLEALWPQALYLAVFALAICTLSVLRFRRSLT